MVGDLENQKVNDGRFYHKDFEKEIRMDIRDLDQSWKKARMMKDLEESFYQMPNDNKSDRVQTSDAFWLSACVLVSEWSF